MHEQLLHPCERRAPPALLPLARILALAVLASAAASHVSAAAPDGRAETPPAPSSTNALTEISHDIQVQEIAPGVWRIVTWFDLPRYGRIPANALLVVSGREALLVNTGWTDDQAARLADWAEAKLGARIRTVVPTHSHADTMGGLAELHRRRATSWAQEQTAAIARAGKLEEPRHTFGRKKELTVGVRAVELAFHGGGHTRDNVVVWLPAERILFGGCLVKAAGSRDLGDVTDAVLKEWPATIEAVLAAYPDARLVVPGHGDPGDRQLLTHTLDLLRREPTRPGAPVP